MLLILWISIADIILDLAFHRYLGIYFFTKNVFLYDINLCLGTYGYICYTTADKKIKHKSMSIVLSG